MSILYIASPRPRVGKTALACALARCLSTGDHQAFVAKALTFAPGDDPDTEAYRHLLGQAHPSALPITLSQDQLPRGLSPDVARQIQEAVAELSQAHPLVIVEGLNSLSTQELPTQVSAQLAQELDAHVLLVVGFDHELSAADLASSAALFGQRLVGMVLNGVTHYQQTWAQDHLMPALRELGVPVLGWIPEHRTLLGVTVAEIARHLGGQFLSGEDKADGLVEHFLIGGLVLDSGTSYFERVTNKAVIVRGSRPDIQMAALHSPTACLVLTGGEDPIEYVRYEAQEEEVPLIKVAHSTMDAATKLEELVEQARFDHPRKLECMVALLQGHLDLKTLSASLGL